MASTSGAASASASTSTSSVENMSRDPSTRLQYATELQTMQELGFTEERNNLRALILCNGNVEAAVNLILGITGSP